MASRTGGSGKLNIAEKLECTAGIDMDSAETAAAMTQIFLGLVAMQQFKQAQNPDLAVLQDDMLKHLKIRQNGSKVMLKGRLSEGLLEHLIEKIGK